MEETTTINNEEMEKDIEKHSKGKLGHEEEKRLINVVEETRGEDHTSNANANAEQKAESSKIDSPKKTRKPVPKTNVTHPRPFNLATEKRMTRERKGSMDFKQPKPILSKSSSFNPKTSNHKGTGTSLSKTSSRPIRTNTKDDKNREEGDKTNNAPMENPTFKALPLPNFYHKKHSPPKPETKKMVVGRSRPPVIGDQVKTLPKYDNNKTDQGNAKRVSKGMGGGGGAKEIISKVIRNTKNSLRTNPKETAKDLV